MTPKQQAFATEYLKDFNATQAAIRAGYSPRNAGPNARKTLKNPKIAKEIKQHLTEKSMSADEVLARLADQAKGSAADYLEIDQYGHVRLDIDKMAKANKLHLIKKYKVTKQGTEIELYDAQAALVHLGKHHGIFTDKATKDWRDEVIELLKSGRVTQPEVIDELGESLATELFVSAGISADESREAKAAS